MVAEWTAAQALWGALLQTNQLRPVYESNKLVYGLTLVEPEHAAPATPICRRLSPDDFPRWDPLYLAHMAEEGAPVSGDREERSRSFDRMLGGDCSWWGL